MMTSMNNRTTRPTVRQPLVPPTGWVLLNYAIVIGVVLFYVFPLAFLVNTALKSPEGFASDPTGLTKDAAFGNFAEAWTQGGFGNLVLNTLMYSIVAAAISVVFSVLIAYPVARAYVRGHRFILGMFVVSLFLPNIILSQFQLVLRLGLYDTRLGYLLIMSASLGVGPLIIISYLRSLPKELDEAAALDGCGYFRFIWTFVVPLCKPVLATVFILQMIGVWNDIIGPTIYLASPQLHSISQGLFAFYGQNGNNQWSLLAAATLIVAAPLILFYAAFQRFFVSGVLGGALK